MADTPDWLKPTDNDLALANSGTTADVEEAGGGDNSSPMSRSMEEKDQSSQRKSFSCSCGAVMILTISTAFLALFVYSATTQNNDSDKLKWLLFYSLSAALAGLFMVSYMCCFPARAFYVLSVGMAIWAIVIITWTAIDFSKAEKGGAKEGTGDNDNQTLRQELGYELGGASLSLLSSLYHITMVCCCVDKSKKDD
jgi:Transmembrane family 220, helix